MTKKNSYKEPSYKKIIENRPPQNEVKLRNLVISGGPQGLSWGPEGPPSPLQVLERRGAVGPPNFLV